MPPIEVRRFAGHARHAAQLARPVRVAHLTDQHVGRPTPHALQLEAARRANDAEPDVVVLTGDYVCYELDWLDHLEEVVAAFTAPVFAVLGNHDHWCGASAVRGALRRGGAEILDNSWTTVEVRGERVQIVGLDDAYTGHADPVRATRGLDPDRPTIGLSHVGELADSLWDLGVPLVFSGHTHAGQVAVGGLNHLTLGRLAGHRYVHGLYGDRCGDGAVYVGAGIGSARMPLRVGRRARREVAVFELGAAPRSWDEPHVEQRALPARRDGPLFTRIAASSA